MRAWGIGITATRRSLALKVGGQRYADGGKRLSSSGQDADVVAAETFTWLMPMWSVLITQGSLTQEADLQMMRKLHSPSCAIHHRSGGVAL